MYFSILNKLIQDVERFIGVDIGGTNTKIGIVTRNGKLTNKVKYPTAELVAGEKGYVEEFCALVKKILDDNSDIKKVGIGVPGLISKDRRSLLRLANIPSLSGVNFVDQLESLLPGYKFALENDANFIFLSTTYQILF